MNGRTAKILRGKLGFKPAEPREYNEGRASVRYRNELTPAGLPIPYSITGTIKAVGARRSYQAVKRNRVLRTAVLRAA